MDEPLGGACERCGQVHEECGAHNKQGTPCGSRRMLGLTVCWRHGGATKASRAKNGEAKQQILIAKAYDRVVRTYGQARNVSPAEAILEEVHRTAGIVTYLEQLVGDLNQASLKQYDGEGWEKQSVWVTMYQNERAHLVKACSEAIRCGVAEKTVALKQQQGALLASVVRGILEDLGVAQDVRAPEVVRRHMALASVIDVA